MAKFYSELNETLLEFIEAQKLFFTATAPIEGRINISPKGMDTFRCIDNKAVAYLDLTGSGNETAAHLNENGRMTIMFCSFSEQPLILRLYGYGKVVSPRHKEWQELHYLFDSLAGERQIIVLEINSVQTACGFGVPIFELKSERELLVQWANKKGKDEMTEYWRTKNQKSIDGLPTKIFEE